MKSVFSICKIFSFCFLVGYSVSSCRGTLTVYGNDVPKTVTITVTGYDTTTEKLTIVDEAGKPAEIIQAWPGQKIKWKIKGSGIKSIDSIVSKANFRDAVFSHDPHEVFLSSTWAATIKDEVAIKNSGVSVEEEYYNYDYNIFWKLTKKGKTYKFDPRIQIHTR